MTTVPRSRTRQIGGAGPTVFPVALGVWGMSGMYGAADNNESIATIHAALDRGATLLDAGDYYGAGHNAKFGALRAPGGGWLDVDTRAAAVKNFVGYSLTRLGLDHIDIYRPGRLASSVRSRRDAIRREPDAALGQRTLNPT